jgi:ketosteroid isomerase-like protein
MTGQSEHPVHELDRGWVDAELAGDSDALNDLATDDFILVGPLGFVLDKQQWLARYQQGDLVTSSLSWHDVHLREYGDTVIAVGVHTQEAAYRGQPNNGSFRATHIAVRRGGSWRLAGMHLSPMAGPPAQPTRG